MELNLKLVNTASTTWIIKEFYSKDVFEDTIYTSIQHMCFRLSFKRKRNDFETYYVFQIEKCGFNSQESFHQFRMAIIDENEEKKCIRREYFFYKFYDFNLLEIIFWFQKGI